MLVKGSSRDGAISTSIGCGLEGHPHAKGQQPDRHRQSTDAFAVHVGTDMAIAGDRHSVDETARYLRMRKVAAVRELRHQLGQAFPPTEIAEQDEIELAV